MYVFIKYDQLLEKYNHIWNKVSNSIKKRIWYWTYLEKNFFFKTKIISYGDESKDFSDKEMSNVVPNYIFKWWY